MRKRLAALALLSVLAGCAASPVQLQSVSSGHVGCSPAEIAIEGYQLGVSTSSWTAKCKDQQYYCSGTDTLKNVTCAAAKQ